MNKNSKPPTFVSTDPASEASPSAGGAPKSSGSSKAKPLTNAEVELIAQDLQALVGSQFQECWQSASEVGFGFYHDRGIVWLSVDLQPLAPVIVRLTSGPRKGKKMMRPLTLFVRSRFLGRRLKSVVAGGPSGGRILVFAFHRSREEQTQAPCELELRLFPHGQNVIARDGKSQIAELKPKEVPTQNSQESNATPRTWEEIEAAWRELQSPEKPKLTATKTDAPESAGARDWRKAIEKKAKAIGNMQAELDRKLSPLPAQAGHWLKEHGTLDVPKDFAAFIDPKKSLSYNIEACFHRAKENARKASGTRERMQKVQAELDTLKEKGPRELESNNAAEQKRRGEDLLARADARGRRHKIADDLEVYIGKSAADNLALLRRAQPFDYWLHLRERPSSHAIIRRTRTRIVNDAEFREAGRWLVEQTLGKRANELKDESFDLLIVECRYVRPIKGDALGRVHYTHDRVLRMGF